MIYLSFLGSYNICIIYLHVTEAYLKVTTAMFYFYHLKNLPNVMKNIFSSISIYSWKKVSLLTHMRNKCIMREINLSLTLWKMSKFFLQKFFVFNMITISKEMENIRTYKEIHLQILINLDCQDSIRFGICQVVYKWRIVWEEFLLPIFCKMFW